MKVLHIVGRMNRAGLETMLMNYYRAIDRQKIQFDFLVLSGREGAYDDEIRSLGGRVIYPEVKYSWKKPHPFIKWFDSIVAKEKYDILHSHNGGGAILFSCAKKHNMKIVVHSHNTGTKDTSKFRNTFRNILHYFSYKQVDAFYACSKEAGEYAFGERNVTVVKNAIDINKYTYDEETRIEIRKKLGVENELLVGTVGRLTPQKNPDGVISIFDSLLKRMPNSKFLWVGTGELEEYIKAKLNEKNIEDKVIMTGAISNVNEMLQAMDVFILPSLWEGLGIVAIEAQAAGLPTICSDCVPKEATVSDLCHYVSLNECDKWVDEIESCVNVYQKRSNPVVNVRQCGYDIHEEAKKLMEMYLELAGR